MFCYQSNNPRNRIKCSSLYLCLLVAILNDITTLYDRLGHTLCKGPLEPNSLLQGPLFSDCYSPYDDTSDGNFHDPNSYEMFSRFYPRSSYRRTSKNYLVR